MKKYDHKKIEAKWRGIWEQTKLFSTPDFSEKPKCYVLDFFPYPSGEGLHVGHVKGYSATDVYAHLKRRQGFNVLHPMGWDAFGLPAENFAIKKGIHPAITTAKNIGLSKNQLQSMGFSYDWDREVSTTDPNYYKWTQWIFVQLFNKGLAYEAEMPINWCPSCKTGLANEEVVSGKCERCGAEVVRKNLRQWVLKITAFADRLLNDLDKLDWPEAIKAMQRNWIGRSEGAEVLFKAEDNSGKEHDLWVFTTRPDTLFGATFMVVAPEHELVESLTTNEHKKQVEDYVKKAAAKSDLERTELTKEKTGVFTGSYAKNPVNGKKIPIWIADYVLVSYGHGAIMAVPAHDQRDWEFAKRFELEIVPVLKGGSVQKEAFVEDGAHINSDYLDGLNKAEAIEKVINELDKKSLAKKAVNYKIRDWLFSRQRYWGEPIPVIHCKKCGLVAVPEDQLPLTLPEVEKYEPTGTGESPLATIEEWVNTSCPTCGGAAKRETNTMPQWAGSCWYYLRFLDPKNDKSLVDFKKQEAWIPVDLYVGGAEHAVLHLLYARFWHKFLFDLKVVSTDEPFAKLRNVGLILAEDGRKMSKSLGNVVNPMDVINEYGADSLRMYELFMGPFEMTASWNTKSLAGVSRFLNRYYTLAQEVISTNTRSEKVDLIYSSQEIEETAILRTVNLAAKKVAEDIEDFKFNTALSALMECVNELYLLKNKLPIGVSPKIWKQAAEILTATLAPFAPFTTEEIWSELGFTESIHISSWPEINESLLQEDVVIIVVQVNGKVRANIQVNKDSTQEEVEKLAFENDNIKKYLDGNEPKKVVYIPNKILNIVV